MAMAPFDASDLAEMEHTSTESDVELLLSTLEKEKPAAMQKQNLQSNLDEQQEAASKAQAEAKAAYDAAQEAVAKQWQIVMNQQALQQLQAQKIQERRAGDRNLCDC